LANLATVASQFVLTLRSYVNPQGPTARQMLNYFSADTLTAQAASADTFSIPANTTGYTINLGTTFPAMLLPLFIYVSDITSPGLGFKYYFHTGSTASEKQVVGASGFVAWLSDGATAPNTIYIDNPTNSTLLVECGVVSN
jgi:hypothetical protein